MFGVLAAFVLFAGLAADSATGVDYLSYGPHKLCTVMGGEYDAVVSVGGNGKDAVAAHVPHCTAGPSTVVEGFLKSEGLLGKESE